MYLLDNAIQIDDSGNMSSPKPLDVVIIGGGIGGLCLAQGLRRAGIGVTVYERTQARTDWLQGYRIHINPDGSRALYNSLPPAVWQRFRDTVSANDGGFGFATEQLDDLLRFAGSEILPEAGPADAHYGASRITLREVLLSDLDDVVHLGKTFERYETDVDGRVTAYFSDGTSATADVLIGADGANSRVRLQLLPDAERIDTGILAIAGKYRLDGANLPRALREDANMIIPTGSGFLFTAVWQPDRTMIVEEPAPDGFLLDNSTAYTFWAYADQASRFPLDSKALSGRDLQGAVLDRTAGWAPALRELIGGSDPSTVNAIQVRSAIPVSPWPTGPVTLLGDAIHNMTPMAGIGANTALRDADLLRRQLIAVASGERDLIPALHEYEEQMLDYGFVAVKRSLNNARQAGATSRLARGAFRTVLRVVSAVPPLRRLMINSLGQ
jgi:2-polyprenyl-6-methoxyphenol hydroxylase-like FAD-dependent oxidoreductase